MLVKKTYVLSRTLSSAIDKADNWQLNGQTLTFSLKSDYEKQLAAEWRVQTEKLLSEFTAQEFTLNIVLAEQKPLPAAQDNTGTVHLVCEIFEGEIVKNGI
jgi:tartrate dehydratase alpha subunit/fumarate hydratase class I-like protein